jgi:hypothetical protein
LKREPSTAKWDDRGVSTDQEDFVSEMFCLVFEEGFLSEATLGVIDVLPGGDVRHGPWIVGERVLVLSAWLDAGWLSLCRLTDDGKTRKLPISDASELVRDGSRWSRGTADGLTCLCPTDEGASIGVSDWYLRAEFALRR